MYKKRALVLGGYLSLLALAACGPKVIDDSDLVSLDYTISLSDWTLVEQWSKDRWTTKRVETKKSSTHEAKKIKKKNQYSNVKNMSQWKINAMFEKAYWDKKQKWKKWKK